MFALKKFARSFDWEKKRKYRFKFGKLSNWKKAIVKLHPEDKIEFF